MRFTVSVRVLIRFARALSSIETDVSRTATDAKIMFLRKFRPKPHFMQWATFLKHGKTYVGRLLKHTQLFKASFGLSHTSCSEQHS